MAEARQECPCGRAQPHSFMHWPPCPAPVSPEPVTCRVCRLCRLGGVFPGRTAKQEEQPAGDRRDDEPIWKEAELSPSCVHWELGNSEDWGDED